MYRILLIIVFFLSGSAYSQTEQKDDILVLKDLKVFVPAGWKAIALAEGDLNKDGVADAALVIEQTKKENFIENDFLGPEILNTNPRNILILIKGSNGVYKSKYQNSTFIPSPNNSETPCLEDIFMTDELKIEKGVLTVKFHYWLSCGSYGVTNNTYKFRIQDNKFTLIGFDSFDFSRSTGESTAVSINFLTKKKCITSGENEFYPELHKPATKWTTVKIEKLLTLEDLQWDTEMDF